MAGTVFTLKVGDIRKVASVLGDSTKNIVGPIKEIFRREIGRTQRELYEAAGAAETAVDAVAARSGGLRAAVGSTIEETPYTMKGEVGFIHATGKVLAAAVTHTGVNADSSGYTTIYPHGEWLAYPPQDSRVPEIRNARGVQLMTASQLRENGFTFGIIPTGDPDTKLIIGYKSNRTTLKRRGKGKGRKIQKEVLFIMRKYVKVPKRIDLDGAANDLRLRIYTAVSELRI